jgi:uncharacterized protein
MTRSRSFLLLAGMLLIACATSYVVPKPQRPEAAGLAIDVDVEAPVGLFTSEAQIVYFVRLDGAEGLQRSAVLQSTMAIDGRAYLLNVPAGEYAAVAAAETKDRAKAPPTAGLSIELPDSTRSATFFSDELVEATRVTVAPGHFAFMGRLVVDTSVGLEDADSTQLHYLGLLAPGAAKSTIGQIFSPESYQYLGTIGKLQRDPATLSSLRRDAARDLSGGGWNEILAAAGGPAAAPTDERPPGTDVVYAVCTDLQTQKFQAQGHGDQSQVMAHALCQIAAGGCRENPSQEGCKNTLRELDAHLKASESSMLFEASHSGQTEIAKVMIAMGSDPNAAVAGGWTPVLMASAEGHEATVAALLDAGADPNARNDLGRSPLMFASSKGFTAIVKVLLAGGADAALRDKSGNTALALAEAQGHTAVARLLKEHDRAR